MIERVLDYLYTHSYNDVLDDIPLGISATDERSVSLAINGRMYALGEKYGIWALKDLARQRFEGRSQDRRGICTSCLASSNWSILPLPTLTGVSVIAFGKLFESMERSC